MCLGHFDRDRPDLIHNMSYLPRTTVESNGLDPDRLPATLKGNQILVDPGKYLSHALKEYLIERPGIFLPAMIAVLELGPGRSFKTYTRHIEENPGHEQKLLDWMLKIPPKVIQLPRIGLVKKVDKRNSNTAKKENFKTISTGSSFHLELFLMARSNKYIYIREKSPILSRISIHKRLRITFLDQWR